MKRVKQVLSSFRVLTRKRVALGTMGAGGVVCAQAAYLHATYQPLTPPSKPTMFGVERWNEDIPFEGQRQPSALQPTVSGDGAVRSRFSGDGAMRTTTSGTAPESKRRNRNVLLIGDSLVVGIGCENSPVMPQAMCRQLAQLLKVDITWRALGVNGADVRTMHQNVLNIVKSVQAEQEEVRLQKMNQEAVGEGAERVAESAQHSPDEPSRTRHSGFVPLQRLDSSGQPRAVSALIDFLRGKTKHAENPGVPFDEGGIDAVVVMCGLNDFKKFLGGRTNTVFREDMEKFVIDLREQVGPDCLLVFPAIPIEETRLPEPIKTVVSYLSYAFDEEKRLMAIQKAKVEFIPKPAMDLWKEAKDKYGEVVAGDGVHPNEVGYKVFAEHLGREMVPILKKHIEQLEENTKARIQKQKEMFDEKLKRALRPEGDPKA